MAEEKKPKNPKRIEAYELWKSHNGHITNRAIAEKLEVPEKTISAWKSRDKWNGNAKKEEPAKKRSTAKENRSTTSIAEAPDPLIENDELTEKQKMFCIYYIKSFNATMSAIKAGYSPDSAHVQGSVLLKNPKVAGEIRRLKGEMQQEAFLDATDVLMQYMKIAFSDITDFAWFGKKEVEVMNMFGPVRDDNGDVLMKEINYVDFKDSEYVDGTIITEVKQGKEGIVVKMADKMEALKFLTKHFDMVPDHFKRQLEEERLKIAHAKAYGVEAQETYEDDGFNEALNAKTAEVWSNAGHKDAAAD